MALSPGFHEAGQTSPFFLLNWKALTSLRYSSTFLPTPRSLMLMCLRICSSSMMKVPRRATPRSVSTPQLWAIYVIGKGYLVVGVGQKGEVDLADAAVLPVLEGPLPVGVLRVDRAAQHLAARLPELFGLVRELDDLGWAHECEVQGVEEQQQVLVLEVLQLHVLERLAVRTPGGRLEVRGWLTNYRAQGLSCLLHELTHILILLYRTRYVRFILTQSDQGEKSDDKLLYIKTFSFGQKQGVTLPNNLSTQKTPGSIPFCRQNFGHFNNNRFTNSNMKASLKQKFKQSDMDPYSVNIVQDLLQGTTDWKSIDDIIKLTFKALTDVVRVQSQSIRELKLAMPTRASKSELSTGLSLKANTSDVSRTIAQISNVLENRISTNEFHTVMKDYVTRYDVQQIMTSKVNVDDIKQLIRQQPIEQRSERSDPVLMGRFEELQRDLSKKLANFVSVGEFQELLTIIDQKANVSELNQVLESKASKQALATSLQKKLSKNDLDLYLSKKADISDLEYLVSNLETKVDLSTIEKLTQVIENKCDKSDLNLMMNSIAEKSQKAELQLVVQAIDEVKARFEKQINEVDLRITDSESINSLKKNIQVLQENMNHVLSQPKTPEILPAINTLKFDLLQQISKSKQSSKNALDESISRLREQYDSQNHLLKEVASDVAHWKRKQEKLYEQIDQVRRRAQEINGKSLDKKQFIEFKSQVVTTLDEKLESHQVQLALNKWEAVISARIAEEKQDTLSIINTIEKSLSNSIAQTSAELVQLTGIISKKQDKFEQGHVEESSKKARKDIDEFRRTVDRILAELQNKLNLSEYENDLIEIRKRIEGIQKQLINKANIKDVCVLADSKPNVEQVNKALKQIHQQLDSKVSDQQLKTVIQDQASINQTLCSQNILGRWIWHSGDTKTGSLVPWQSESVNTLPENFLWDKDKTSILTLASGMYEISVCFFSRSRPVVNLIINGEEVITRNNEEKDAAMTKKKKQKDMVGMRLTEYLMLPPRARISIAYNGEHGAQGFLNIKRL